jgi:hypothetical protein
VNQLKENFKHKIELLPFNYGPGSDFGEMRPAERLKDGSTYIGGLKDEKYHGRGVLDGPEGKYEGFWVDGKK